MRHALGTISVCDLDIFCASMAVSLETQGASSLKYNKRLGLNDSHRFEIGVSDLIDEIRSVSKHKVNEVGLYFEHPRNEEDRNRYIVWVYHTVRGKSLTLLRKYLLNNIIFYNER